MNELSTRGFLFSKAEEVGAKAAAAFTLEERRSWLEVAGEYRKLAQSASNFPTLNLFNR